MIPNAINLTTESCARQLIDHIISLGSAFEVKTQIDSNYGHLGACLADAVLQSNNNYERNVRHRVTRIRSKYRDCITLRDLKQLLLTVSLPEFLNWAGPRKQQTFLDLVDLLGKENLETEDDFRSWLLLDGTRDKLLAIRFVGPKTIDYLGILVGLPRAAIDRHLFAFLVEAGLDIRDYTSAQDIIHTAADLMGINRSHLDHSVWRYMSGRPALPTSRAETSECRTELIRECDRRRPHTPYR